MIEFLSKSAKSPLSSKTSRSLVESATTPPEPSTKTSTLGTLAVTKSIRTSLPTLTVELSPPRLVRQLVFGLWLLELLAMAATSFQHPTYIPLMLACSIATSVRYHFYLRRLQYPERLVWHKNSAIEAVGNSESTIGFLHPDSKHNYWYATLVLEQSSGKQGHIFIWRDMTEPDQYRKLRSRIHLYIPQIDRVRI